MPTTLESITGALANDSHGLPSQLGINGKNIDNLSSKHHGKRKGGVLRSSQYDRDNNAQKLRYSE